MQSAPRKKEISKKLEIWKGLKGKVFPEHWARILGKRTKNIHLKEFTKKGTDHSLECFRPLLDGTTNWPAVMEALDATAYDGYLTFEYFHPYQHYPEALIYQTSDSLDRLLGKLG